MASRTSPTGADRDREAALLTAALRVSGKANADGIQMVPYLYMLGQLPAANDSISHLDVLTAYPNAERLMELEIAGSQLKRLMGLQPRLSFFSGALPVWLDGGRAVSPDELDDARTYKVVATQLVAEGGLDWTVLRGVETHPRPLDVTCAELVWDYLRGLAQADPRRQSDRDGRLSAVSD